MNDQEIKRRKADKEREADSQDHPRQTTELPPSCPSFLPPSPPPSSSCNADETRALTPTGLQEKLDALMAAPAVAPHGRVFVRPSGTEDVVRVYAGKHGGGRRE